MADGVVYTGFDPEFGDRLDQLIARAKAEGYNPNLISGTRSAYGWPGMKGQSQADLYSQLGKPGGPRAAAAPGYSPHQYGVASDVTGIPQSELERLAPQVGLRAIHDDPNHVELANWRQEAAAQPAGTPWGNVPNVPSEYASNASASAPGNGQFTPPGTSLNTTGPDRLASMVGTLESGGGRYASAQPTSMVDPLYGQYPGFANTYGRGAAGIDNYAQAVLSANPKASVGDFYAGYFSGTGKPGSPNFNNFDLLSKGAIQNTPGTPAAQKAAAMNFVKNAGVDPSAPLASVVSGGVGPGPGNVGPATGFLPGQSVGQGPIGSDAVASKSAAAPAAPSIASQIAGPLQSLTKSLDDSSQQQQSSQGGQQAQQLQAEQAAAAYGQQRQQALAANASQLMAQILAQGRKPLSWGQAPPGGSAPGTGAGQLPRLPNAGPSMPDEILAQLMQQGGSMGTGLNSMGDYNG